MSPEPDDLDAQLDAIATPEQINAEIHKIHQQEVARRVKTSAKDLMRDEPDRKHLFFKPTRPPMVPLERKFGEEETNELPDGFRRAKLLFGDMVPEHVKIGVVKRWNTQMPMSAIVRWANDFLRSHGKNPIEGVDIFAIVDHETNLQASPDPNDPMRSNCEPIKVRLLANEMNLDQFRAFIFQWKKGAKFKACMDAANFTSTYFGRERFAELSSRWRAEALQMDRELKARRKEALTNEKIIATAFRCKFNGIPHLVIPYSALPNEILEALPSIRVYQPTVTIDVPATPPTPRPKPVDEDEDIRYDSSSMLSQLDDIAGQETERRLPGLPIEPEGVPTENPTSPLDDQEFSFEE